MQGPASEREKERKRKGKKKEKGREKANSTNIILVGNELIGHKLQKE